MLQKVNCRPASRYTRASAAPASIARCEANGRDKLREKREPPQSHLQPKGAYCMIQALNIENSGLAGPSDQLIAMAQDPSWPINFRQSNISFS
jgi:hypothetical protein